MTLLRYKLDLQYVGESFNGWQTQLDRSGVQDKIEAALSTILGRSIKVIGASRTDSGVHAQHQIAIFETNEPVDELRLMAGLTALLPASIGVAEIVQCREDFHPIVHAVAKAYCYRYWRKRRRDPFWEPYIYRVHDTVDVDAMKSSAQYFVGKHDFTAFCAVDSGAKTRERRILAVEVYDRDPLIEFWVLGEGFLKQMVRIMAGTLLEVGLSKRSAASLPALLQGATREAAGITLPAKGLTLEQIFYETPPDSSEWAKARKKT